MKQQGAAHEHAATDEPGAGKGANAPAHPESATAPKTNDSADTSTPTARQQRVEQRKKGMKGQAEAPKTTTNPAGPAAGAAAGRVQRHQFRLQASKMRRKMQEPRRRSRTRSRCNRLNRSTRTFVRSRSRSRFRRSPTTRIIESKEAIAGRASIIKYSARIIRNGTIRDGITRITNAWS